MQIVLCILCFILSACSHKIHKADLTEYVEKLEKEHKITIGINALNLDSNQLLFAYKDNLKFPMASTMKVPVGIYLLNLAQNNKISLDKMVRIEPGDLVLGSGLMGYFLSRPGLSMSLYNMFEPMLAISDNSATDIILENIGGPKAVYKFLHHHGIEDITISRSLRQIYFDSSGIVSSPAKATMTLTKYRKLIENVDDTTKIRSYKTFAEDPRDTTTPQSMTLLLSKLYHRELLNEEYTKLMLEVMAKNTFKLMNKYFPANVEVSHKNGTWYDINSSGPKYYYKNDVGIITLPEHKGHFALSIYVRYIGPKAPHDLPEVIAKIGLKLYQFFTQ